MILVKLKKGESKQDVEQWDLTDIKQKQMQIDI
jgi:hypothetical protein